MQLHQPNVLEQLANLEANMLVLSLATLPRLQQWVAHFQANFLEPSYVKYTLPDRFNPFSHTRFLADPDLVAYHAYGLGQNRPEEVYSREILRQYARWRAEGRPVQKPLEDPLQRGGDFVINRANRLTLAHTGHNQTVRPSSAEILAALR